MNSNLNNFVLEVEHINSGVLKVLEKCRKDEKSTDVQLQIKNKLFLAHSFVLLLHSPVLKSMISEQRSTTKVCVIIDESVDSEIFEDLLSFLYTGKIILTPDNAVPVCVAANYLQISKLLDSSATYLCQLITLENVLTLFELANRHRISVLHTCCTRFIALNHEKLFESSEIRELPFERLKDIIVGLKERRGYFRLRENSFDCIVGWTGKVPLERLADLPILLENIPLEQLTNDFLTQTVSMHPLVKESASCTQILSNALAKCHSNANIVPTEQNLIVLGGKDTKEFANQSSMFSYDPETGAWRKLPNMIRPRAEFSVTVDNEQNIIVCGGEKDYSSSLRKREKNLGSTIEMFDWAKHVWTELPEMPEQLQETTIAMLGEQLYVVGKLKESDETSQSDRSHNRKDGNEEREDEISVLRYCFPTQQWEFVKSIHNVGRVYVLIEYNNHLYAFAGKDESFYAKSLQRYDPVNNEWREIPYESSKDEKNQNCYIEPDFNHSCFRSAAVHQKKIYFCGTAGFDVYDPETNIRTSLPRFDGYLSCLVSMNDKLLAVGGQDFLGRPHDHMQEYNFFTNKWIEIGKMESKRYQHRSVAGKFY